MLYARIDTFAYDAILDYPVNTVLIHEVVKMQLACRRAGTHATKTKGLVSGGGSQLQ